MKAKDVSIYLGKLYLKKEGKGLSKIRAINDELEKYRKQRRFIRILETELVA